MFEGGYGCPCGAGRERDLGSRQIGFTPFDCLAGAQDKLGLRPRRKGAKSLKARRREGAKSLKPDRPASTWMTPGSDSQEVGPLADRMPRKRSTRFVARRRAENSFWDPRRRRGAENHLLHRLSGAAGGALRIRIEDEDPEAARLIWDLANCHRDKTGCRVPGAVGLLLQGE